MKAANADPNALDQMRAALLTIQRSVVLEAIVSDLYIEAAASLALKPNAQMQELGRLTKALEAEQREYAQGFLLELKAKLVKAFEERRTGCFGPLTSPDFHITRSLLGRIAR